MVNLFDYAHDNKLFKKFKVNDLLFTEYKCTESRSVFPVWSHYNYFVYVLSGKKQWQTLDAEFLVQSGEAIFVRRGSHIIHKFFEVEFCALFIFVPDSFIVDICRNHSVRIPENKGMVADIVFPLQMEESLSSYFQSVFSYFLRNEAPPVSLLEIKFRELFLNLISSRRNGPLCEYFHSLGQSRKISVREVMENNFPFNLKLEEFARLCGRSLSTFKRDFVETFQTSPGKWLVKKRLELSRRLLETTDKNINQLALETGFENTSHFITVFKKEFGITPHQWKTRSPLPFSPTADAVANPRI